MHVLSHSNTGNPFASAKGAGAPQAAASPASADGASSTTSSSSSGTNPGTSTATITANDFLQLLVTELKNQDPTANTDPNEYVNQLVQVNSLQQEIQMNQTLDGGPTLTGASNGVLQELTQMNNTLSGDLSGASTSSASSNSASALPADKLRADVQSRSAALVGNQSTASNPVTQASADTIANALTANPHQDGPGLHIPSSQMGAFAEFAARLRANPVSGARP